jgi:hypothetical protein
VTRFGDDGIGLFDDDYVILARSDKLFDVQVPGVLRNDFFGGLPEPNPTLVEDVKHGTLEFRPDGTFDYQPAPDFVGIDTFRYSIVDAQGVRSTATVRINVMAVNDPPLAADDTYTLPGIARLDVPAANGLLANDSDAEGDSLRVELVSPATHGHVTLRADGSFSYTPDATFALSDQFTYVATDGFASSELRTVQLRLNVPTIMVGDIVLAANTPNQIVPIYVTGGQLVSGLDLYVQVGDGGPELISLGLPRGTDAPSIAGVRLKDGTIFAQTPDAAVDLGSLPQVATWAISLSDAGSVAAEGLLATLVIDTTGFFAGNWPLALAGVLPNHPAGPLNTSFATTPAFVENGKISIVPARVVAHHVFYNNSAFDGNDRAANAADDLAIAPDKHALLPGQQASFANYTSYSRGLNGVMLDVEGLPADTTLSVDDFVFRLGRSSAVGSWQLAPPPAISVRRGAGVEGSDRVTLVWPDNAIDNAWLEVRVKHGARTLLGHDQFFYFGNAIGETGNAAANAFVTSIDVIGARDHQRGPFDLAPLDDVYDFNRDRIVSSSDVIMARDHQVGALLALPLISPPPKPLASVPSTLAQVAAAAEPTVGPRWTRTRIDVQQVDAVCALVQSGSRLADFDRDGITDGRDRNWIFSDLLDLHVGDVNLDGQFDSSDLVAVMQRGRFQAYDGDSGTRWSEGDWDGDGDFDADDLASILIG